MTVALNNLSPAGRAEEFEFTGKPRKIESVKAIPFIWPSKIAFANDYIRTWQLKAVADLCDLKLSRRTLDVIASHTSRRDGTCRLTDRALASRSSRSVSSTKRDIQRLKKLGYIIAEYEGGNRRQERIRVLKITVPISGRSSQRMPEPQDE